LKQFVRISYNGESLQLRFTYLSKRYTLTVPKKHSQNTAVIDYLINLISDDLINYALDESLRKYKQVFKGETLLLSPTKYVGTSPKVSSKYSSEISVLFSQYLAATGVNLLKSKHHYATFRMIERWEEKEDAINVTLETCTRLFLQEKVAASTFNKRKNDLKKFYNWAMRRKLFEYNPFLEDIASRSLPKSIPIHHAPFSEEEVIIILNAIQNDSCCEKKNQYKHSYYYNFVKFIFHTGVRVGEACSLKVRDINLAEKTCRIHSAYGIISVNKWSIKKGIKSTKTEKSREIELSDNMCDIFLCLLVDMKPNDLVFPGPKGSIINSKNFNQRVFYPLLDMLNIERRVIYAGRHTFASHAVAQEVYLPSLQYALGHTSINTTMKYYNEFRKVPKLKIRRPGD